MNNKILILITVFILALFLTSSESQVNQSELLFSNPSLVDDGSFVLSSGEAWLTGWDYRKQITITGQTGAGTNYPVQFDVEYGSGSDSGSTVYLSSNSQTDFDDVRFTDNDGDTELDYWREEYTGSGDASFWVEVADSLESSAIIYIYYGKVGVSTTSDIDATFIWADDFENNNLNKWSAAGAAWSAQGTTVKYGSYAALGNAQSAGRILQENMADISTDAMIMSWVRKANGGDDYHLHH